MYSNGINNGTDSPLVSIICITYNHESYIRNCLDGFINQITNFNIEILIHDDASLDNTVNIIKEYEQKYPGIIKPIYQIENQFSKIGYQFIENLIFSRAKSKYIAFCEGDDYWIDPLKLQKQVDFLEANNDYGLVFSDINFFFESENKIINKVFQTKYYPLYFSFEEHVENAGYLAPCTWLIRSNVMSKKELYATDWTFITMLDIMLNSKIYYLPEVTAVYRYRSGSASKQKEIKKKYKYFKGIFETRIHYCKLHLPNDKLENKLRKKGYINLFFLAFYNKDWAFIKEALLFFYKNRFINNQNEFNKVQILYFYFIGLIKMTRYLFVGFCKISTRRILILLKFNNNTIAKVDKMFRRFLK
ncbi:MAG: glycosyltransferase [Bacteroidales bacterium]